MDEIIENYSVYKNIAEERVPGISEYKRALAMVAKRIQNAKYPLYGGMAIDFALKAAGHEGIYAEHTMPDYDAMCPDPIAVSVQIKKELERQFSGVSAFNALHLTTRRVRILKTHFVADLTFVPEPYFSQIPRASFRGFVFVHPDFQRVDMHRSLAHLYEGSPGREVFRNRTSKDIKRFGLLQAHIPISAHEIKHMPVKDLILENYNRPAQDIKLPPPDETICLTGWAALALHLENTPTTDKSWQKLKITNGVIQSVIDPLEYISTKFHQARGRSYEKCIDFIYEAKVDTDIVYNGEINIVSAKKIGKYNVVGVHYLCMSFLFRYFMLGNPVYLDVYRLLLSLPLTVETKTFGHRVVETNIYALQKESCEIEGKTFEPRPIKEQDRPEDFVTYQIAGRRVEKLPPHTTECPV